MAFFIWFIQSLSLMLFCWNLVYMYWLSSKQLEAWIEVMSCTNQDGNVLYKNFTIKMDNYRLLD